MCQDILQPLRMYIRGIFKANERLGGEVMLNLLER